MKKILTLTALSMLTLTVYGQVELGKTKNTIMGKGKLVALPYEEIIFDNFSIMINRYKFEEDQGGSNNVALSAKVGVRANLTEVDPDLAKEITDEAYAYFVSIWEKRGKKLVYPAKQKIESSKLYSKAKSKGKQANFINGGSWENTGKKINQITTWPSGVEIPQAGEGMNYKVGNAAFVPNYMEMKSTSFYAAIDFISFKTAKLGSTASVRSLPQLSCASNLTVTRWQKNKVGAYLGSGTADGIEDFYSEIKDEEMEALNTKLVMKNYVADRAKFKANVLEMIKSTMDAQFADYDAVIEKNS